MEQLTVNRRPEVTAQIRNMLLSNSTKQQLENRWNKDGLQDNLLCIKEKQTYSILILKMGLFTFNNLKRGICLKKKRLELSEYRCTADWFVAWII